MSSPSNAPLVEVKAPVVHDKDMATKDAPVSAAKDGFFNSLARSYNLSEDGREQRRNLETCFRGCYPTMQVSKDELVKVLLTKSKYGKDSKFTTHEFVTGIPSTSTNGAMVTKDKVEEDVAKDAAKESISSVDAAAASTHPVDVWMTYDEVFAKLAEILGWDEAKQLRLRKELRIAELCLMCPSTWVPTADFVKEVLDSKKFGTALNIDFVPARLKTLSTQDRTAGIKLPFTSHPIFFTATPARVTENQVITLFNRYFDFSKNVTDMDRKFFKLQEDQYNTVIDKVSNKANKQRAVLATAVPFKKFSDVLMSTPYGAEIPLNSAHWQRWKPTDFISWDEAYRGLFQSLCPMVVSPQAATKAVHAISNESNEDRAAQIDAKVDQIIAASPRPTQVDQTKTAVAESPIAGASVITSADVLKLKQALEAALQEIEVLKAAAALYGDLKKENSKLMATVQSYARQLKSWQERASKLGKAVTNQQQNGTSDSRSTLCQVVDAVADVVVDAATQFISNELNSVQGKNARSGNPALIGVQSSAAPMLVAHTPSTTVIAASGAGKPAVAPIASAAAKPVATLASTTSVVVARGQPVVHKRAPVIITTTAASKTVPVVFDRK
jgi:hypothetical protein